MDKELTKAVLDNILPTSRYTTEDNKVKITLKTTNSKSKKGDVEKQYISITIYFKCAKNFDKCSLSIVNEKLYLLLTNENQTNTYRITKNNKIAATVTIAGKNVEILKKFEGIHNAKEYDIDNYKCIEVE